MSQEEEPEVPELFKLPVTQKDAWTYAWKVAGIAAYCWLYNHFVSVEKYDKDMEKMDARQAMIEKTLHDIDTSVQRVDQKMEDARRYEPAR